MPGAARMAMLPDGRRLHLQHGPIDIVAEAFGERAEVDTALPPGRRVLHDRSRQSGERACAAAHVPSARPDPHWKGRWRGACSPPAGRTGRASSRPMAAVAGSVADEVLAAMTAGRGLTRAYVNNGGDIAVHLGPGTSVSAGVVNDPDRPGLDDRIVLSADRPARGTATSGWRGPLALVRYRRCGHRAGGERGGCGRRGDVDRQRRHRGPSRHRACAGVIAPRGKRPGQSDSSPSRWERLPADARAAALHAGLAEARAMQAAGLIDLRPPRVAERDPHPRAGGSRRRRCRMSTP